MGETLTALCGGALALNLVLVAALLAVLAWNGLGYFWQKPLVLVEREGGELLLGEVHAREPIPGAGPDEARIKLKTGNRDLGGADFQWVDEPAIVRRSTPPAAVLLERQGYGNFYGTLVELRQGNRVLAEGPAAWDELHALAERKRDEAHEVRRFEDGPIETVTYELEQLRRERLEVEHESADDRRRAGQLERIDARAAVARQRYDRLADRLFAMRDALAAETAVVETAGGARAALPVSEIVRAIRPNELGTGGRIRLYASRIWEFVSAEPRESNTEGGIFPAIFGTVVMVLLMSVAVTPLGVLAALYLREYAKQGLAVRIVRIAVNNLAGVPSIVFGVFGLGFFVYTIGGSIDRLFYPELLPTPTFGTGGILWASLTLALLTVPVVIVATEEGLAAVPRNVREGSLALGATKFETTWRVVLPAAAPGMLTGLILAMARAAGEVAPLMIVGMVKLADLPVDGHAPFVHLERKFMHIGFHIFDLGFQSPNVEAVKPLVFATALLLILIVTLMNLVAIGVRNHLRARYATSVV